MPFLGFRWVVNFVLLAVPIGVTLGILMGLDAGRSANGDKPLFTQPDNPGTIPKNNGITPMVSCDKAMGLHPLSKGQEYTLNPNQWGWTEGTDGALCMNVRQQLSIRYTPLAPSITTNQSCFTYRGGLFAFVPCGQVGSCVSPPLLNLFTCTWLYVNPACFRPQSFPLADRPRPPRYQSDIYI
ncbi:hypothetical protein CTA2_2374 [Colletotrichum tanaceti]|nr:hypothetical protein CTA2_2374 [Colletotrichum tanaceti]